MDRPPERVRGRRRRRCQPGDVSRNAPHAGRGPVAVRADGDEHDRERHEHDDEAPASEEPPHACALPEYVSLKDFPAQASWLVWRLRKSILGARGNVVRVTVPRAGITTGAVDVMPVAW